MLLVQTKKSALKSKDFFTLCAYPSLGKKDILSTLFVPCYCHVGEELAGQPLQKAGHFNVQAASDGTTWERWKSNDWPAAALQVQVSLAIPHCSLLKFFGFFLLKYFWPHLPCFSFVFQIFLADQYGCEFLENLVFSEKIVVTTAAAADWPGSKKLKFVKNVILCT